MTIPNIETVDCYINSRYTSLNPLRVRWLVLDDDDKVVYINQSSDEIMSLPFNLMPKQDIIDNAISENALAIMDKEINALAQMQFKTLQALGQAKNRKYDRREQGEMLGINKEFVDTSNATIPLTSAKAWDMLKVFVYGGARRIL